MKNHTKCLKCDVSHKWQCKMHDNDGPLTERVKLALCPKCLNEFNNLLKDKWETEAKGLGHKYVTLCQE